MKPLIDRRSGHFIEKLSTILVIGEHGIAGQRPHGAVFHVGTPAWRALFFILLSGPVQAQSPFAYDAGAYYPPGTRTTVPPIPAVPNVPAIPGTPSPMPSPNPSPNPAPTIQSSVILNLGTTISGCLDYGKICVYGLPVTIAGKVATGQWGAMRFEFQLP